MINIKDNLLKALTPPSMKITMMETWTVLYITHIISNKNKYHSIVWKFEVLSEHTFLTKRIRGRYRICFTNGLEKFRDHRKGTQQ